MMFLAQANEAPTTWAGYWATSWVLWLSAFCVLAIYSYLFRDNAVYRALVQIFIGINIGYGVIVQWRDVLFPQWWLPMLDGLRSLLFGAPGSKWGAMWFVVGVLGLLWYFQLSRRYLWLSRIVIGLIVGIGAGLTFKSQFGQNIPQAVDSFRPLGPSIVGPQPVKRFALPATTVPMLVAPPVAYLADDRQVVCVEVLGGTVVWRTALAGRPVHALRLDGDSLVVPGADMDQRFDRSTGARQMPVANADGTLIAVLDAGGKRVSVHRSRIVGLDREVPFGVHAATSACVVSKVTDPDGHEHDVVCVLEDGWPRAYEAPSGRPLWDDRDVVPATQLADGGRVVLGVEGRLLSTLDPLTGKLLTRGDMGAPVIAPSIIRMPQPTQDQLMSLSAAPGGVLIAAMTRENLATSRKAGEVLWRFDNLKPVSSTATLDGVALVSGPQGGWCYEIPPIQPRLNGKAYFDNWVFVIALLSVMTYFFFSFRQRTAKGVAQFSLIGRWTLMIGFGAIFGNTIMTRMSFLLDRLMFLINDWLKPLIHFILHR